VLEEWAPFSRTDFKVMAHVGHACPEESEQLARHAESCGVDSIASLGPIYFKPADLEGLVSYCERIAGAAPSVPFYYYHVPALTGIHFSMPHFMEQAIQRIPNFRGIKYSHEDLFQFSECLD